MFGAAFRRDHRHKRACCINALRHGLSLPLRLDIETSAKAEAIARVLTGDQTDEDKLAAATELARPQLDLLRIRKIRTDLMAMADLTSGDLDQLRRLAALDHYERLAHTKRRQALRKL